jgi:hypothetical protein
MFKHLNNVNMQEDEDFAVNQMSGSRLTVLLSAPFRNCEVPNEIDSEVPACMKPLTLHQLAYQVSYLGRFPLFHFL